VADAKIYVGDNRETLKKLDAQSVQTVITSPPYWGLRDYGTAEWVGGDADCSHKRESKKSDATITGHKNFTEMLGVGDAIYKDVCNRCGAVREDDQIGLEITPEDYVEQLCLVFDEVWRVLKDDGTLWLNLGDSYVGTGSKGDTKDPKYAEGRNGQTVALNNKVQGLKNKDLVGIPWRVAFALQARGWYLRQDIIWAKPNPMPESVLDRCTKSHEYIFLLSKSNKYFFDNEAIKEPVVGNYSSVKKKDRQNIKGNMDERGVTRTSTGLLLNSSAGRGTTRNKRDVWTIGVSRYKEAHFATYPAELITPCVLAGSKTGDIVLDPFSGSGTTGEVALTYGRSYIGLELNPEYALLSEKRILDSAGLFDSVEIVQ
jgi:DNA modification methylase